MSNIEQNLQKILSSRYGKDVRQAIHDGIHDCYEDGKAGAMDLVARERIDNLVANNNPTEGNSELIDIRVGADGKTYPNAGDAVREQVSSLKEDLGEFLDEKKSVNIFDDNEEKVRTGYVTATGDKNPSANYFNFDLSIPYGKKAVASYTDAYGSIVSANFRMAYIEFMPDKSSNDPLNSFDNDFASDGITVTLTVASLYRNRLEINIIPISEADANASGRHRFTPYSVTPVIKDSIIETSKIKKDAMNYIYVSTNYNTSENGYGVTKFSDVITAHDSILDNSEINQYTIIVKEGVYDFGGIWLNDRTETYVGILLKDFVWIKGENSTNPNGVVFKWYGEDDYPTETVITTAQAMKRCPVHITQNCQHGGISNIKFDCRNVRYCLHPETNARSIVKIVDGYEQYIELRNCIFAWGGRPNCDAESNQAVACGLEPCSTIKFYRCKFNGNLGFHNNAWNHGTKPTICNGSKAYVESCVFDNSYITYSVMFSGDAETYELLDVRNCSNIKGVTIADKTDKAQKLIFVNEGNAISGLIVNPFVD